MSRLVCARSRSLRPRSFEETDLSTRDPFTPVPIQPARLGRTDVADRVSCAGRNEHLLASPRAMDLANDLELHVPLNDHDDLIRVVDEVGPYLTRWVDPGNALGGLPTRTDIMCKAPRAPFDSCIPTGIRRRH